MLDAEFEPCATAIHGRHTNHDANAGAPLIIWRHPVKASWPCHHVRYFLTREAAQLGHLALSMDGSLRHSRPIHVDRLRSNCDALRVLLGTSSTALATGIYEIDPHCY